MTEGQGASQASQGATEERGSNLWSLLPSFDPSSDNAKEYADKVRFLWGICPPKDRPMLAPRLALLCKGTAWSQVKGLDSTKLTDGDTGYKTLLSALSTWEESAELQTYDHFERAFYKTVQKPDETAMSYVNRINVAFQEVGAETTVKTVKAFVILRQSGLSVEDKKRVIAMADGYDPSKIESAIRSLSTKILGQGDASRKKIYPVNYVDDEVEETYYMADDDGDEEAILAALIEEGDEYALTVQEFEENIIQVCQETPEISMAFSAYQEARAKIKDRVRGRGFWPIRGTSKGKGKAKKGKGFQKRRQSLAERIASSACRLCGMKGHWKDECPSRDRQGGAEANVTTIDEEMSTAEIATALPSEQMASWEAQKGVACPSLLVPSVYQPVNEEFVCMTIPRNQPCLHVKSFQKNFRRAIETSFGVVRSQTRETESSQELGPTGSGIIDTGASKSVIGEKRVSDLLASLKPKHRQLVKWQGSETVFRFGNNGTLKSLSAIYVPFGAKWFRIEVVQGWTPFLISNAFLRFLGADLLISQSVLRVPIWKCDVVLSRNSKGLFTVSLHELIEAACKSEGQPCSEEVISWASSSNSNKQQTREVYCTQQQQALPSEIEMNDGMPAAKVAQPQSNRGQRLSSEFKPSSCDRSHGDALCEPHWNRSSRNHGVRDGTFGCSVDWPRRSQSELRTGTSDQESSPSGHFHTARMGRDEVAGRQVEGVHLCRDLSQRREVCALHDEPHKVDITMGSELSELCSSQGDSQERVHGNEEEDGKRDGEEDQRDASNSSLEDVKFQQCGLGGDLSSSPVFQRKSKDVNGAIEESDGRRREDHDASRAQSGSSRREDHQDGGDAARTGSTQGRAIQPVRGQLCSDVARSAEDARISHLCQQLETAQLSIEKDLAKLQAVWKNSKQPKGKSPWWNLDVLEVYCGSDSQITEQCLKMGLRAERFTIHDGDLATPEGRAALWKVILEKKPREIWMSPECKYWGNFSRRNMGRSISTANKILDGREKQRVHLKLCNKVFLHQMSVGGHFHMEQPQGSEAIDQPELKDVREGTLCTVFDMCEVGKLLAPKIQWKLRGNNFLRKRTTVFTSSRLFHKAFDHRLCVGNHIHMPIAGKVFHLGRWISVSEYAARYTTGFGRNVARYLSCCFANPPVLWDELCVFDVDFDFIGAVMTRKRDNILFVH